MKPYASETTCIAHALVKSSAHEAITAQMGKKDRLRRGLP